MKILVPVGFSSVVPFLTMQHEFSMNLARREMAVVLATLFRRYDLYRGQPGRTLELYDTERARDVDANFDMIIPVPANGSKGVRIRVRH